MNFLVWSIIFIPLSGFISLIILGKRVSRAAVSSIGVFSVGISAVLSVITAVIYFFSSYADRSYSHALFTWIAAGNLEVSFAFRLDSISLLMVLVVAVVSFLIHLYSAEFMTGEEGYHRFFAYMNLFVGSMLLLVLADNLLFLYLGWELVGICSYLLIGFWHKDPANGRAARKAFIVTRIGDTSLMVGILFLFTHLSTLNIQQMMDLASGQWISGSGIAVAAAALILGGAVGKSAQLPLQVWLPDAMAGPTPVSALIHAATMVTAGVYLIVRTHVLFALAPLVQTVVALIGAATLIISALSALVQTDIKRVLAYSTISQIGYMFTALGVGAWSVALFHFMIHAFFKALLFLGAGVVILATSKEHNMLKMGGLRKDLPLTFWCFLIGALSLSAFPLVSAGFYSKEWILWENWAAPMGKHWLWIMGAAGAFITAFYTFRMVILVFLGKQKQRPVKKPGYRILLPLLILSVFSVFGGLLQTPRTLGNLHIFSSFLSSALPSISEATAGVRVELILQIIVSILTLLGIAVALMVYSRRSVSRTEAANTGVFSFIKRFLCSGWGFDLLYDVLLVHPFTWMAQLNRVDALSFLFYGIGRFNRGMHRALSRTQSGRVRWYLIGLAIGVVIIFGIVVAL